MRDLIKDLKYTKFETFGLSLLKNKQHDETTGEFSNLFDNWFELGDKSDQEIIDAIQNLNIDILIDLAGLWSSNRVNIFNTRICPLQISWLGFSQSVLAFRARPPSKHYSGLPRFLALAHLCGLFQNRPAM